MNIADVNRELARVRASGRRVVRVRMCQYDIDYLEARYRGAIEDGLLRIMGVPVLPDETRPRGAPEVEYAE